MENGTPRRRLSVGATIQSVFPEGTWGDSTENLDALQLNLTAETVAWQIPPILPYDLFAVCGHIVQVSGLMGFFEPDPDREKSFQPNELLRMVLSLEEREICEEAGKMWLASDIHDPSRIVEEKWFGLIMDLWIDLVGAWQDPVRAQTYQKQHRERDTPQTCPSWWNAVFQLLIIADEACGRVGFVYDSEDQNLPFTQKFSIVRRRSAIMSASPLQGEPEMWRVGAHVATYAGVAEPGIICVQPKSRVSRVGSTLRNLSRNLSLTGPIGGVRCNWRQIAGVPKAEEDEGLDILLVPMPYEAQARLFVPVGDGGGRKGVTAEHPGWGNFKIDQAWLAEDNVVKELVRDLLAEAKKNVETVNAIIFPELSLNYEMFTEICRDIEEVEPEIEFVIAGSSSNCEGEICNCVLTALWEHSITNDRTGGGAKLPSRLTSQRKHHRWRLERNQLEDYGLGGQLQPDMEWWEEHEIGQRELNFFQFRDSSVFASLICEDLARNDPVHEVVRSVAPNLLFALLMDGPQIASRWSARYAGTLADDPGTSVLTLTSYGLIKRVNDNGKFDRSDSIGLWKDEAGTLREVKLPPNAKGGRRGLAPTRRSEFFRCEPGPNEPEM